MSRIISPTDLNFVEKCLWSCSCPYCKLLWTLPCGLFQIFDQSDSSMAAQTTHISSPEIQPLESTQKNIRHSVLCWGGKQIRETETTYEAVFLSWVFACCDEMKTRTLCLTFCLFLLFIKTLSDGICHKSAEHNQPEADTWHHWRKWTAILHCSNPQSKTNPITKWWSQI